MTKNNDKILVNNIAFNENQIFCFDSRILITGLDVFDETCMTVAPFVVVRFGNEVYNFVDETKQKEIKIKLICAFRYPPKTLIISLTCFESL